MQLGIIEYDDIGEDTLERIKKQFDLLVQQFKQCDQTATIKKLISDPKEFDERDEIIMEKDSEIKKLRHTRDH